MLCATLAKRQGIAELVDQAVDLGERPGAANAGAKVMSLISAMALGADRIDELRLAARGPDRPGARPRGGGTVDARHVPRSITFGHVRSSIACWPTRSRAPGKRVPAPAT